MKRLASRIAFETRSAKRASSNSRNGIAAGALVITTSQKLVKAPMKSALPTPTACGGRERTLSAIRA
jgi:hypothetical protein